MSAISSPESWGLSIVGSDNLMRWLMNSSVKMRPWPVSSFVLITSMWASLGRLRILHTPSSSILLRSP